MPEREACYEDVGRHVPVGRYTITAKDVPVDAFWSVTVYGADGCLHNELDAYNVNSVFRSQEPRRLDITVNLGGDGSLPNPLPLEEGWTHVRMYRPRPDPRRVLDLPAPEPAR